MGHSNFLPTEQPPMADVRACEAWLARAALADPRQACHELTGLLEALEEIPPQDGAYVDILERLREPIAVAQAEHAKKFSARPLPLKDYEQTAFEQVVDLWTSLGRAYRRLLDSVAEGEAARLRPELQGKEALLAQRALDCTAELMVAHYRCRRELDPELWRDLHQLYGTASRLDVTRITVPAGRRSKSVSSAGEAYIRALLLALANPFALGARELNWTRRWATMWAYKVELVDAPEHDTGYAIDLSGTAPPTWLAADAATPGMRFLSMGNLRRSLRSRLKKLEAGVDPQSLGLGKDCVQPESSRLLAALLRAWIDAPSSSRQFNRRLAPGRTELTSGFESIHVAISGKLFKSAARHWDYTRRDAEQLFIYQGVGGSAAAADAERQTGFAAEKWETLDESALGFRLRRKGSGDRLYYLQLVALKPEGAKGFILCEVRWLSVGIDQSLTAGTIALPGLARAVAVRPAAGPEAAGEPFTQAFLLPDSTSAPNSLVLPSGWYQHGREIELRIDETVQRVKLMGQIQRGYDYDRANFSVVA